MTIPVKMDSEVVRVFKIERCPILLSQIYICRKLDIDSLSFLQDRLEVEQLSGSGKKIRVAFRS